MACYKTVNACRSCGAPLIRLQGLRREGGGLPTAGGDSYMLNAFPRPEDPLPPAAPLALALCSQCALVQLQHSVDRDLMYREYWYRSGINESMVKELDEVALWALLHLSDRHQRLQVLDIGANDGTLLRAFKRHHPGCYAVGVDPAYNVQEQLTMVADEAVNAYWPCEVPGGPFHVVTSIACLYDTDDLQGFCQKVAEVLHPQGVWVLQVADLGSLVGENQVDSICHEHVTYLGVTALHAVLQRAGLRLVSLERNQTNGGSMRVAVAHVGSMVAQKGLTTALDFGIWQARREVLALQQLLSGTWFEQVRLLRRALVNGLLDRVDRADLWAYGASTKGNTLLQWLGLTGREVVGAAERNPEKVGRTTVTGVPIFSEEEWRKAHPRYTLVLPWHFRGGILEREQEYLRKGGQLIFPLPSARVFVWDEKANSLQVVPL